MKHGCQNTYAPTHTHTNSLSSISLRRCHASSAKLHNRDRLPNASAPRKHRHSAASCSFQAAVHPLALTHKTYPIFSAYLLTHISLHIPDESFQSVCVSVCACVWHCGPRWCCRHKKLMIFPKTQTQYSPYPKINTNTSSTIITCTIKQRIVGNIINLFCADSRSDAKE